MFGLISPQQVRTLPLIQNLGKVTHVYGAIVESSGPDVFVGELVEIQSLGRNESIRAEVIGIRNDRVIMMLFDHAKGIRFGSEVRGTGRTIDTPVGNALIGRILNGVGDAIDGRELYCHTRAEYASSPINPIDRSTTKELLSTGVKVIDGIVPLGVGQRVGLFAGSGVGKSTLLSMMARGMASDINVIALIGERGREVTEFIEEHMSDEVLSKSILVVATSDSSALMRKHAAQTATIIAEHFREQGKKVSLFFDSLTRYAMALREIGLSLSEPPTARGYTPSVFSTLPGILERGGCLKNGGAISAVYSVLVEGDDVNDPIADYVRSILDGHIVLDRKMAEAGTYPPVSVLKSESRLKSRVCSDSHKACIAAFRGQMAELEDNKDMLSLGAYKHGTNEVLDHALRNRTGLLDFIRQQESDSVPFDEVMKRLHASVENRHV